VVLGGVGRGWLVMLDRRSILVCVGGVGGSKGSGVWLSA